MAKLKVGTTIGGRDVMDEMDGHVNEHIRHTNYAAATGSANNYAVTLSPAPSAYVEGMCVVVKININNTGASTINVNGLGAKSIKKSNGNDVSSGNLKAGSIYTVRYNGTNFILQGEGGEYGTAQPEHVLEDYTFGTEEGVKQGEMTNNGPASAQTVNLTSQNQEYTISQGYHTGLRKIKAAISGLVASVIKAGTTVGGILGTFTSDATAAAGQILSGVTAYVNGSKITGTMPNRGSNNIQAQFESDVLIPAGYYNGSGKVLRPVFSAGNNVQFAADNNVNESATSYRRKRNIQIGYKGTFRVYWSLLTAWDGETVWGRIYINGVPAGVERSTTSPTEVFYTEDFSINAGDRIELWMKATYGSLAQNYTFEIRTAEPSLTAELSPL